MGGNKLFRLKQAVLEYAALIDPIAVGAVLGDADRAWVEAEDVWVAWCWLIDILCFNPDSVGIPKDGTDSYGIYESGVFKHCLLETE